MKNKKIIIAAIAGFLAGTILFGGIAWYQARKKTEARYYVTAMAKFINGVKECRAALDKITAANKK